MILNHPNRTSITQVMVSFLGLLRLRLFNDLCPDFFHNWYIFDYSISLLELSDILG